MHRLFDALFQQHGVGNRFAVNIEPHVQAAVVTEHGEVERNTA